MSENTKLWDNLGRTDPSHTQKFTRGGGFKGTAIKPIWSFRRMTEEFGPCGEGWGVGEPSFQVVPAGDETLVYCTTSIWYTYEPGERQRTVYGVGGDKVVAKFSSGLRSDDEAFKKAFTDAITNALKLIGVGADVHMGLFDDSKYVSEMRQEFADEPTKPEPTKQPPRKANGLPEKGWREDGTRTSYALKKEGVWAEMEKDLIDANTPHLVTKLALEWSKKAEADHWNPAFKAAVREALEQHMEYVKNNAPDNADDFVSSVQQQFPGSNVISTLQAG